MRGGCRLKGRPHVRGGRRRREAVGRRAACDGCMRLLHARWQGAGDGSQVASDIRANGRLHAVLGRRS